jgi:two-component system NtrC family sensor kinase
MSSLLIGVIIIGAASMTIGIRTINNTIIGQAHEKVKNSINTTKFMYHDKIYVKHRLLNYISSSYIFQDSVRNKDKKLIYSELMDIKKEIHFDILNVVDAEGRIIVRARNFNMSGDDVKNDLFVNYILKNKKACYGFDVMDFDSLLKENKNLAEKAIIKIQPTKKASVSDKHVENRGMVLKAASPIFQDGEFIGIIYGALLLNNDYDLVDNIRTLIFGDEKINGIDLGTTTIFLDDLRISTNVKTKNGQRAIGTRVSNEVYKSVFIEGKLWVDKAFVVDNWYISAYSPIYNIENKIIGIMYNGILEEKYNSIIRNTSALIFIFIVITAVVVIVLNIYFINLWIGPIKMLVEASKEIIKGNYHMKVYINTNDEMNYFGIVFNKMAEAIMERDRLLRERTQKQIVQTEKLASLGRLASGIAHEINNPLTGILTYGSLLLEDLVDTEYEEDLHVIVNETLRCRNIVKGILDFARETRLEKEFIGLNKIITDTLLILEKHVNFQNVKIVKKLSENMPDINLDVNQMKSIINNLAVNAADAMPDGGTIEITTYYNKEKGAIVMEFFDNGIGIPTENLNKIFDPFFTTKDTGKGTGLGLAVCYGIIERHNGLITVRSTEGVGTTFTIELPAS